MERATMRSHQKSAHAGFRGLLRSFAVGGCGLALAASGAAVGAEARSVDGSPSALEPGSALDDRAASAASVRNGRIAYARYRVVRRDARVDIYTVRSDGSGTRRLTFDGASSMPQWSPGGGRIAFKRDSGGGPTSGRFKIVVMGAGGTNKRVLATGDDRFSTDIAWSPDGRRLVYTTSGEGGNSVDIWVVRVRTGEAKVLIGGAGAQWHPVWSPDGTRIAYECIGCGTTGDNYQGQVYVYALATGESTPVTPPSPDVSYGTHGGQPAWSPNGVRLAYARYHDFEDGSYIEDFHIAVVRADGTGNRLVSRGARDEEHPDWRPWGSRLLFTIGIHSNYPFGPENHGIATIKPDGTDRRRISTTGESFAEWSPDGRRIVAIRPPIRRPDGPPGGEITNKQPGVWVLHPSGDRQHRVAAGAHIIGVDWQPRSAS